MAVAAVVLAFQLAQAQAAPPGLAPDAAVLRHAGGRAMPRIDAVRAQHIAVDGRLDDAAWQGAPPASEFRMVSPNDGADPTERTEVRIVYDDDAIYVGARMFDSDPASVTRRLYRRDNEGSTDHFTVLFDSYHDHRTSFRFRVNPAGVRSDGVTFNDNAFGDDGWDPVWDAAASVDSLGWTAEIRIPFSQLRFPAHGEQVWGVNFTRQIDRKNEFVRWAWAPNTEQAFASVFGHLTGLQNVPQPRRLEVMPYSVASGQFTESADGASPFDDGSLGRFSAGLDIKYGLTSNLTLDATINPDFGQVESDPAFVNLSAFEQFLTERRPFFVEGSNLFQFGAGSGGFVFGAPQLFYSRRVGRQPSRFASAPPGGYADVPQNSTILGATKLSGRVGAWSLGLLQAVTDREEARLDDGAGNRSELIVEPLTSYGVFSLRRDFRGGSSGVGFMATNVYRDLPGDLQFLRSSAQTAGMDFFHRFARNQFAINGSFSLAAVRGDSTAIIAAQRSSARYYQRPDQEYVSVDSAATSLVGYAGSVTVGKVSGNWTYGSDFYAYSPGFEINDAGFQTQTDRVFHGVRLGRRWLRPGAVFRQFFLNTTVAQNWNFGGTRVFRGAFFGAQGQLRNYWYLGFSNNYSWASLSDKQTRGGPLLRIPSQYNVSGFANSDYRQVVYVRGFAQYSRNRSGGWGSYASVGVTLRPSGAMTVSLSPSYNRSHSIAGYVAQAADGGATATYGRRYVFADLDQTTWDATLRLDFALSPRMSLQLYAQPFIANADYNGFKEFDAPGQLSFVDYGTENGSTITYDAPSNSYTVDPDGVAGARSSFVLPNPDFRTRSLISNLVFRWEWQPGSTLFLVWNHGQSNDFGDPTFDLGREFRGLLRDDQVNTFLVKVSYWLSY